MQVLRWGLVTCRIVMITCYVAAFLYGLNVVMFILAIRLTWKRAHDGPWSGAFRIVGRALVLLFLLVTAHAVATFCNIFIRGLPSTGHFANEHELLAFFLSPYHMVSYTAWMITDMVATILLLWRCWILWNQSFFIISVSSALMVASMSCASWGVVIFSRIQSINDLFTPSFIASFASTTVLALVNNVFISVMICARIYFGGIKDSVNQTHARKYWFIFWAYAESGALYPMLAAANLSLYILGSPWVYLTSTLSPHVDALVPAVMVIAITSYKSPPSDLTSVSALAAYSSSSTIIASQDTSPPEPGIVRPNSIYKSSSSNLEASLDYDDKINA